MSEDFLSDSCFIEWVQSENHEVEKDFWQAFLERYPQKRQEIETAKSILNRSTNESLSNNEVESIWNRINLSISIIN